MSAAQKGWQGHFFEDFEVGQKLACPTPRALGEGEVAAYIALTGDRTPRFCGPARLVHPLLVFHTVMGQSVRQISLNARANLGYAGMRFTKLVEIGAVLQTEVEVLGLKENSNGKTGIVWVRTTGRDQSGDTVLEYTRWVMVKKRGEEKTRWSTSPSIPDLPAAVDPSELWVDTRALPTTRTTYGRYFFEDYTPGERIVHFDGQTVNPSDHMTFTRLFQNSAKIHFDALLTEGTPLVYGGFPMSIGYAQAFNGMENRLGLAAINAGTHANPVHAGDTLYSFTTVVETVDLGEVGALRCQLYVVKNRPIDADAEVEIKPDGKRYDPSIVLDLDFWELIAKRGSAG